MGVDSVKHAMGEAGRRWMRAIVLATALIVATAGDAAQVIYVYDDAGRLKSASYDDGKQIEYELDAAGNRKTVRVWQAPPTPTITALPAWNNSGNFTVAWTTPATSVTITRYELFEAFNGGAFPSTPLTNSLVLNYSATGRAEGRYTYQVRACSADGCGNFGTWSTPVAVDRTAPTAVPYTYAVAITSSTAEVTWNAAEDNFELAEYQYRVRPSTTWLSNGLSQILRFTGLTPQTEYIVEIRAGDRAGNYGALNTRTFTTLTLVPFAPQNLQSNHAANCAWNASWDPVPGATSYTLRELNGTETTGSTTSRSVSCPLNEPESNKPIWVRACNANGCSSRVYFGNVDQTPPSAPGVLNIQAVTHNSANVSWPASTDNVLVTGYFWRLNGNPTWTTANGPSVNLTGLNPLTLYNMEVTAFDAIGNISTVRTGSFTTLDAVDNTPPSQPGTVSISNIRPTLVTVGWVAATDNVGVTGYRYKATIQGSWTTVGAVLTGELGGLSSSTQYTVEVQARDQMGNWGASRNSAQFTTAIGIPPAPTGLQYNHAANCAWNISWNSSANATYYVVRDTTGNEFNTNSTSGSVNCPLNDPEANKPRYVRACNTSGCSTNSEFGAPIVDGQAPTQPGAITVDQITATSARAQWGISTDNVGVTSYEYQLNSGSWTNIGLSTTANLSSLAGSTSYTLNVVARDLAGNPSPVRSTSFTTTDVTAPTQPGLVSFSSVTATTATAGWGASSDNVGVTGYEYRLRSTDGWTAAGTGTSVPLSGLSGSTSYAFEVRAFDNAGNRGPARGATLTTLDVTAPTQPGTASIDLIAASTARATWGASTDNVLLSGYEYRLNGVDPWINVGNVTTANLSGLADYTLYTFEVRARDSSGNTSTPRAAAQFRTLDGSAPSQPGTVTIDNVAGTSARATWSASSDNVGVAGYEYRLNGAAGWTDVGGALTVTMTGLTDATTYNFEVRARDAIGLRSVARAAAAFTTPDITSPSTPGTINVTPSVYSASFNWGASSDNVGIFGYDYKLSTDASWTNAGPATGATLSSLSAQSNYTVELRARDAAGNLSGVRTQSFTTQIAPPLAPTGLSYSHVADCAWNASWNSVSGATSYTIRDTNGMETSTGSTSFSINCPLGNPEANKPRWVKACNSGGCSPESNFSSSGGDGIPPTQPGLLNFTNLQPSSVTAQWGQSSDNVGVVGYQYSLDNQAWVTIANVTSVNLSGLQDNRNYPFSVRAIDAAGLSSTPRSSSFTTPLGPDVVAPSIPGTISLGTPAATQITFSWGAASDAVGVTQYEYRVTAWASWLSVPGTTTSATISTLSPSTSYTVQVRARDAAGNTGPARDSAPFTTPAGVPSQPQWPTKNLQADCSWRAEWWQPASGTVTRFELRESNGTTQTINVNAQTSYPIQRSVSCEQGNSSSNYPRWVRACNTSGCGQSIDFP